MSKAQAPTGNKNQMRIVRRGSSSSLTQEEAEAKLSLEGYQSYCWYDVPGTSYPKHKHELDECLWILNGEIHFTFENETHVLRSGDKIYIPAQLLHTAQIPLSGGVTYLVGEKNH